MYLLLQKELLLMIVTFIFIALLCCESQFYFSIGFIIYPFISKRDMLFFALGLFFCASFRCELNIKNKRHE